MARIEASNGSFLSCGGLGCSPAQLFRGLLHANVELPDWFQNSARQVVPTYQGRNAIALICRMFHVGPGNEVVAPAYNCGAEIDPYLWAGARVVFYRVDDHAAIDLEDIRRRVNAATRIIHVTHFFGWPQEIRELAAYCKERGLILVEDCALSLFSAGPHGTIGRIGDAAIYSFAKSLPVPDGGALIINGNPVDSTHRRESPRFKDVARNSLPLMKHWMMHKSRLWQRSEFARKLLAKSWLNTPNPQTRKDRPDMPLGNYFNGQRFNWSISRISQGIIDATDSRRIFEIRRRNYRYLANSLKDMPGIQELFPDLPEGVCPLAYPIIVEDREYWYRSLTAGGILIGGWPSYHRDFDWQKFPEAQDLKNRLLTLPIHQDLELFHLQHIANCVKKAAGIPYLSL